MLFNSFIFVLFFLVVFTLHWLLFSRSVKWQNCLLLAASLFFYACWDWRFLFLLIFSISLDYFSGLKLQKLSSTINRKIWLYLSVGINLGFLGLFKYFNFFIESFQVALKSIGFNTSFYSLNIIIPIGISFYTFHGLSYVIDCYHRKIQAERNIITYSLFVSFFPLLVAGPIERATHLLPQLKLKRNFQDVLTNSKDAILLFGWGLFKKIVVADNVAGIVDNYYASSQFQNGGVMLFSTYLFAIQIYCDFSGYSDMAKGLAKLLGIDLFDNFKTPYFSSSLRSFWSNWHISLSSWLKDYVYIPMGGNRRGELRTSVNIMSTNLISGFWHGANWTFLIWGFLNGLFLVIERFFSFIKFPDNLLFKLLKAFIVFNLVSLTWIFFRAENVQQAFDIVYKIFTFHFFDFYFMAGEYKFSNELIACLILVFFELQFVNKSVVCLTNIKSYTYRLFLYLILFFSLILLSNTSGAQFIYFQF